MLTEPKTSDRKNAPPSEDRAKLKRDASAEFIHDLAESGTASELSTVKAASDAVEGENEEPGKHRAKRKDEDD